MFGLDNPSGVSVMPPITPASNPNPLWFTEGGAGLAVSYPGQEWFNIVQAELLSVLQAANVRPDKSKLDQLAVAIKSIVAEKSIGLTDKLGNSSVLAASQKLVSEVNDNSNSKLAKNQNGADIPDKNAFVKNLGLVETVEKAKNTYSKSESDNKFADKNTLSAQTFNAAISATDTIFVRDVRSSDNTFGIYCDASREMPAFLSAKIAGKWVGELSHPNKSGTLATLDDINVPVGVPLPYPHRYTPAGYLTCNGQTFDKSLYPKLAEAYPAGRVPDLRGEFIRGWDDSRGVDPGRVCGTWQGDAIQNITGSMKFKEMINGVPSNGAFHVESNPTADSTFHINGRGYSPTVTFDASRVVPTANENRPRNVAFNYIVRAV
ncbi:hypothetical protein EAE91_18255 [Photorhabdus noenieputensis]|uniref:phage tail protein n=1 Tax=Photorhabdus noenieputensis TaxID=1208607 RepID=UPI001BD47260|nr:phage tail protein [Photorhabdus noenieputensis]MBS9439004.1 hypothetical protein [Photorhabdus noenieputensis]MCK3669706.1 tail fiber protein [Photorhabdus noenieputensis]